jgi:hypothetical protein
MLVPRVLVRAGTRKHGDDGVWPPLTPVDEADLDVSEHVYKQQHIQVTLSHMGESHESPELEIALHGVFLTPTPASQPCDSVLSGICYQKAAMQSKERHAASKHERKEVELQHKPLSLSLSLSLSLTLDTVYIQQGSAAQKVCGQNLLRFSAMWATKEPAQPHTWGPDCTTH